MDETSIHHAICTSRGGSESFINKKRINKNHHGHYHSTFGNALPHEAIAKICVDHIDVMTDDFVDALAKLLAVDPSEIYQREAFVSDTAMGKLRTEQKGALRKLLQRLDLEDEEPVFVLKFPALDYSRRPA